MLKWVTRCAPAGVHIATATAIATPNVQETRETARLAVIRPPSRLQYVFTFEGGPKAWTS
jgi:hypothetical protein